MQHKYSHTLQHYIDWNIQFSATSYASSNVQWLGRVIHHVGSTQPQLAVPAYTCSP